MHLLQSLTALTLSSLASLSLCGCGQSSAPSGGHEAATASAALADRPPAIEGAATAPSPQASIAFAPAASASAAPSASTDARTATKPAPGSPPAAAPASAAPSASAVAATPTAAPTAEPKPIVEVMSPKVAEGTFNTWMQSSGRYTAWQQGNVQVVLVAKGEFHCNDKYPYKFKLGAASGGVSYPTPIVRAEGIRVAPERSIMTIPFVPSASGDARVSGTFSFSVCSAATCQIETRELALTVKVD
ncbi:MAG: hypothetical protein ACMG6S_30685 [Byssovorax sp.]